jgi:hypothetical protein
LELARWLYAGRNGITSATCAIAMTMSQSDADFDWRSLAATVPEWQFEKDQ